MTGRYNFPKSQTARGAFWTYQLAIWGRGGAGRGGAGRGGAGRGGGGHGGDTDGGAGGCASECGGARERARCRSLRVVVPKLACAHGAQPSVQTATTQRKENV